METENIERIIDKEEDIKQEEPVEDEKSINEEEEESEANNEEMVLEKENNQIEEKNQENIVENENINKQEEQYQEITDPYSTSTYILKYKRTEEELKELASETNLPKSENCLFMLNIKILKEEDNINSNSQNNDNKDVSDKFLVIFCHEIAAIYFDEIYERIYTLEDLFKENKFFRVFEKINEARNIIDESIKKKCKKFKKNFY